MPSEPAISETHDNVEKESDTPPSSNGESSSHALPEVHAPLPAQFPTYTPTPPPILKKPSATNGNSNSTDPSQKTTRLFLTGIRGQHIRKPSSPLTPMSPPPFAALPGNSAGNTGGRHVHYQKRPHFVAGKAGRRRPVLPRRKSSQTHVPSLLRSEVRVEPDVSRGSVARDDRSECPGVGQEDKPVEPCKDRVTMDNDMQNPRDARARDPEQKQQHVNHDIHSTPNQQYQGTSHASPTAPAPNSPISDFLPGIKLLLAPKTSKDNHKARPRYSDLRHLKATPPPMKLVDDHFRLRFAKEMQREETMLKAINSLPEPERSAILERCTRALTGREPPKQSKTAWLVVPGDEAACHEPETMSSNSPNDDDEWLSITGDETVNTWTPDDAQDSYSTTQADAIPFKLEGMSYSSSSRAASRLRAPGQLTVLLRAEQYGYRSDAGIVNST